ncbi:MAG: hypothetical protein CL393_01015 [Acidiferrobacteraceae bacterium]|nr:hypothetical protein [Acidiferrobacteraceae bacterium]
MKLYNEFISLLIELLHSVRTAPLSHPEPGYSPNGWRWLTLVTLFVCFTLSPCLPAYADALPTLGPDKGLSRQDERELGRLFKLQVLNRYHLIEDPEINLYLDQLEQRIRAGTELEAEQLNLFLVADPSLNAFAGPDGQIGLHSGLVMAARSESELAGVVSHETAHISQHHLTRMLSFQRSQSLPTTVALITGLLLGGQIGAATLLTTRAALVDQRLKYTRSFEAEADAIGLQLMAKAGFNPQGMVGFFRRLEQEGRLQSERIPEYLRTHPLTENRISEIEDRISGYRSEGETSSRLFGLIRARLIATQSSSEEESVAFFRAKRSSGNSAEKEVARYGLASALNHYGHYSEAVTVLDELLDQSPDEPLFITARARVDLAAGRMDQAISRLREYSDHTQSPAILFYLAEALLAIGRPAEARSEIRKLIRIKPQWPANYKILAGAEGALGKQMEATRAQAEYHILRGSLEEALELLKRARRLAKDNFYALSGIEARIQELVEIYTPDKRME